MSEAERKEKTEATLGNLRLAMKVIEDTQADVILVGSARGVYAAVMRVEMDRLFAGRRIAKSIKAGDEFRDARGFIDGLEFVCHYYEHVGVPSQTNVTVEETLPMLEPQPA